MACAKFSPLALWLLASGLVAGAAGAAQTYKWVDENGKVHYTDRLPPEVVNRGVAELNKQGMTKKVTDPAPTPEQRKVHEEKLERQRQSERTQAEVRRQENALLSSYTTELDIDVAKRRNLALVGNGILSAEARIKSLERRAVELEHEKLNHESRIPDHIARELASIAAEIPKQHALIAQRNIEALAIINRYDEQKSRFRELKARIASDAAAVKKQ